MSAPVPRASGYYVTRVNTTARTPYSSQQMYLHLLERVAGLRMVLASSSPRRKGMLVDMVKRERERECVCVCVCVSECVCVSVCECV